MKFFSALEKLNSFALLPPRIMGTSAQFLAMTAFLCAVAIVFPITPDEWSRMDHANRFLLSGEYNFFWPPLSVFVLVINPALEYGPVAVRLFNLALTLPVFFYIASLEKNTLQTLLTIAVLPYLALVVSTASQQGLMIALLGWLVLRPDLGWRWKAVLLGLSYSVNPALIIIVPLACLLLVLLRKAPLSDLSAAAAGYLIVIPWVIWSWSLTGDILFTLSTNGPLNLFLGNNPDPLSHRGVGDLGVAWRELGLTGNPDFRVATLEYLRSDPPGFALNIIRKAVLFWAPFDYMRSGMGGGLEFVLFAYFAVVQTLIYVPILHHLVVGSRSRGVMIAISFLVVAWALYTAFFVKIRFRVPFDALLFFSLLRLNLPGRAA